MNPSFRLVTKHWLVAAAAVFALAGPSVAQSPNWTQVTGPGTPGYGGYVGASQSTPDGAFWITTDGGGIHRSADSGASWTAMNAGLNNLRIFDHLVLTGFTPYKMFAATYGGGVFKSVDGAASWTAVNGGLGCTYVNALAPVAPANTRLLAGTACQSSSGIYYSDSDGASWTLANGLPINVKVNNISQVSSAAFGVDYLLAITDSGFYKSTDSGVNWAALPTSPSGPNGLMAQNLRVLFYTNGSAVKVTRLLTTVQGAGVFVSEDNGSTWTASNSGLPANPITFGLGWDGIDKVLYVSLDNAGTYKSTDMGATWTLAFGKVDAIPAVRRITRPGTNLVARTFAGPYKSTDGGTTWIGGGGSGLPGGWTTNLKMDNATPTPNIYASAADGVYKFNGTQWSKMPPLPSMVSGQVKVRGATVYATTTNLGVYKFNSTSGTWQAINTGLPINLIGRNPKYVGDGVSANNAYLGLYGDGVYYTSDAGATWTARNTGLAGNALFINSMDAYGLLIYISTDAGVYKSIDGGLNWALVFAPKNAANQTVPSGGVTMDPLTNSTVYVGVFNTTALGASLPSNGVYKSTDAGAPWTQLAGMAGKKVRDVRFVGTNNTLVASVWEPGVDGGLFTSDDGGATWAAASNGLTTHLVNSVMATGTGGYAATRGAGLFKFDDTPSGGGGAVTGPNFDQLFIARNSGNSPENFGVSVRYPRTSNDNMASYSIVCPSGKTASGAFGTAVVSGTGYEWYNVDLGTTQPATPFDCTSTVTYAGGNYNVATFTVDKFADATAYPNAVSLTANANVTSFNQITFNNPVAGVANTRVQSNLWGEDANGRLNQQLWFVGDTASPMAYNGQPLVANTHYQLAIATVEGTNAMHAAQYWIPFCYQCSSTGGGGTGTTLNVLSGWNLLGNSVEAPIDVGATLSDATKVTTVWKWLPGSPATATAAAVPSGWAFYSPGLPNGGAAYAASKGYSALTTIGAGEGFWVNASQAFNATLPAGTPVASSSFKPALTSPVAAGGTHALGSGWSLLATGDNPTPTAFDAALSTVISTPPAAGSNGVYTNLTTLWAWSTANGGGWYFWAPALVNNQSLAGYITSKNYLDFGSTGTLAPGVGFWVNMP